MADEIELKLDLSPDAIDALEGAGFMPGPPVVARQRSIYFDTADQSLASAGISLRVRRSGRKRVQTIKAERASAGGLFVRSEWERGVTNDVPVIDPGSPLDALPDGTIDALAPAFEVRVTRQTWMIEDASSVVEMVVDRGAVSLADRTSPISEVELELTSGTPLALFALARRIDAIAPVRLGVQSKAERGYRLARPAETTVKAEPVGLTGELTTAAAFRAIVRACLRHYRLNEALLLNGREAGALHQARVALRRLRSAFAIFRPMLAGTMETRLSDELRWLAAELGHARDLDVLLARSSGTALHEPIAAAREQAYDRVNDVLASSRVRHLMLDLAEFTAVGDWLTTADAETLRDRPLRDFAATALTRWRR